MDYDDKTIKLAAAPAVPAWRRRRQSHLNQHHRRPFRRRLIMVAVTLVLLASLGLYGSAAARPQDDIAPAPTEAPTFSYEDRLGGGGGPTRSTYSITTAATADPVASGLTVEGGRAYIKYSTVGEYFLQDQNSTNQTGFDYTAVNFGLLNRTYEGESWWESRFLTQWQRFNRELSRLNSRAARNVQYKLIFIGRHGEGYHNAAESFYGTPAWNCYWAQANGNSTASWSDAECTPAGLYQAVRANGYWTRLQAEQKITPPQSFYTSPMFRCLQTAETTFANLSLPRRYPYKPVVKEFLREGMSIHTCDRRRTKGEIAARFPGYRFERTFTEQDTLWSGIAGEAASGQDYRSKALLDDVFSSDRNEILSFTSHSGETRSILRVVGHLPFSLSTGAVIPIVVRAETVRDKAPATTTTPWAGSAWCTNKPPVTSLSTGGRECVCADGVTPTAISPGAVFTTNPARL